MARSIGGEWTTVDTQTKEHYRGLAKLDRERYDREMAEYTKLVEEAKAQASVTSTAETTTMPTNVPITAVLPDSSAATTTT
jgi:glycerol kinase